MTPVPVGSFSNAVQVLCGEIILVDASVTLGPEENEVCQAINDVVTGETFEFTLAP